MSYPARGPDRGLGIDGKAIAAHGRRWVVEVSVVLSEAAA